MNSRALVAFAALAIGLPAPVFAHRADPQPILVDGRDYVGAPEQTRFVDGRDYVGTDNTQPQRVADGGDYPGAPEPGRG